MKVLPSPPSYVAGSNSAPTNFQGIAGSPESYYNNLEPEIVSYVSQVNQPVKVENNEWNWLQKTFLAVGALVPVVLSGLYGVGRHFELKAYEALIKENNPDGISKAHQDILDFENSLVKKKEKLLAAGESPSDGLKALGAKGSFVRKNKILVVPAAYGDNEPVYTVNVPWEGKKALATDGIIANVIHEGRTGSLPLSHQNEKLQLALGHNPVIIDKNGKAHGIHQSILSATSPKMLKERISFGWTGLTSFGKGFKQRLSKKLKSLNSH